MMISCYCFHHWKTTPIKEILIYACSTYSKICNPFVSTTSNISFLLVSEILSKVMNNLVFVMKCLLSPHLSSSLHQTSRHLHFVNNNNLFVLNTMFPKFQQPVSTQQDQEGIVSCNTYEAGKFVSDDQYVFNSSNRLITIYVCTVSDNQCNGITIFMKLLLASFGWNIKCLLGLVKIWWPGNISNNGSKIELQLNLSLSW